MVRSTVGLEKGTYKHGVVERESCVPYHIPERSEQLLVFRVKLILQRWLDEDPVLELAMAENDASGNIRILVEDVFCDKGKVRREP